MTGKTESVVAGQTATEIINQTPFGLGKPTSGEYNTTGELGYKVFGGQG